MSVIRAAAFSLSRRSRVFASESPPLADFGMAGLLSCETFVPSLAQ